MKELSIVYQNADYDIHYECKDLTKFSRLFHTKTGMIDYVVFFDDTRLKEQFGHPFEFSTEPNLDILLYKNSAAWVMADVIIKAINKEESL